MINKHRSNPGLVTACCAVLTLVSLHSTSCAAAGKPSKREHPYLYFSKADLPRLRARVKHPTIAPFWERVKRAALRPPQAGHNMFQFRSVVPGGFAYHITGERRYAAPAVRELMRIVNRPGPWSRPKYHLKYCMLRHGYTADAVSLGYDLLYDAMTEAQRRRVREVIRTKAFPPFMKALARHDKKNRRFTDERGHREWWSNAYFGWNSCISGGVGALALATLDEIPESRTVLRMAREALKYTHYEFKQGAIESGGYDPGAMYWAGHIKDLLSFYIPLERVTGSDDGFFSLPGIRQTAHFGIDFTAPDGNWVSFADCNTRAVLDPPSRLYYLAQRYGIRRIVRHLDVNTAAWFEQPWAVLYRPLVKTPAPEPRPKARWYRDIQWAILTQKDLFMPFKGGDLKCNHNNLDANSMLLWVRGERMLNDPGYGHRATGDHNALLVNGKGQIRGSGGRNFGLFSTSFAKILECGTVGADAYAVSDATSCYGGQLARYHRHFVLSDAGYAVVFDDVETAAPAAPLTVHWHAVHPIAQQGERGALISGRKQKLLIRAAADSAVRTSIARMTFDRAFRIESGGAVKSWRLFSVLVPGHLGTPRVETSFSAGRAVVKVTVGGNTREFVFARSGARYRYGDGRVAPAPPVPGGRAGGAQARRGKASSASTRRPSRAAARERGDAGPHVRALRRLLAASADTKEVSLVMKVTW